MKKLTCSLIALSSLYAFEPPPQKPAIPIYDHRINFNLARFGYEHIKPEAIYLGIEAWYASYFDDSFSFRSAFIQSEARLGYNYCFNKIDHLTPFISAGYFHAFQKGSKQGLAYGGLGLRYEHEFDKLFTLGLNLEGLAGGSVQEFNHPWGNPIFGFDISVPLTFRFCKKRNWDFRLEPFVTSFYGTNSPHTFYGLRDSIGYRF